MAGKPPETGLSPRGRGNRNCKVHLAAGCRSIPAWAGEPGLPVQRRATSGVYPRVGGGTARINSGNRRPVGLSPRGRGNPFPCNNVELSHRSIPAWAGEPVRRSFSPSPQGVYPRVGGGTIPIQPRPKPITGLSPRGRGNPAGGRRRRHRQRSIPAWAGEPTYPAMEARRGSVYPRVGGGNRLRTRVGNRVRGSIPAWAGEPGCAARRRNQMKVYPRVGGGTGPIGVPGQRPQGLSPSGRGNHFVQLFAGVEEGSIPAWAGEPRRRGFRCCQLPVYPRVGGGESYRRTSISIHH